MSPDGQTIVFAANDTESPYLTLDTDLFAVSTLGRPRAQPHARQPGRGPRARLQPRRPIRGLRPPAEGRRLAGLRLGWRSSSSPPAKTTVLTDGWDNSAADWTFTPDGKQLVFHAEARARVERLPRFRSRAARRARSSAAGRRRRAAVTRVPARSSSSTTRSRGRPSSRASRSTAAASSTSRASTTRRMAAIALGEVKEQTFKGAGGRGRADVRRAAARATSPAKQYPLVQLVHGGPVGTFGDDFHFRWNAQAFAAPGYVVAMVNFHGSSSFGQPFVESILGAHPDKPFTDVMTATDVLIAQGLVDPSRMAAAGGSYGGFLVDWIEGHTDRFKALVSHAGVYEPARPVGVGRHLRAPALVRRLPVHEPREHRALEPEPLRGGVQDADARAPRRARLPRAGHARGSSSTASSRRRASPRASSTTPTRTTGS